MCVCVCVVIPFILDVRLVDAPAGVTQEDGHTEFLHLPFVLEMEKDPCKCFKKSLNASKPSLLLLSIHPITVGESNTTLVIVLVQL